jgi:two-component system phosphate regulon response regulator PhoB
MPQFGATVLVVDDEPDIRAMLHCALGDSGFELIEADDVPDAQLQIDRRRPDVIVLDWMLPTLSGLSFLEQLRQSPRTRGLPVIMLSAKTEELDRVRALEAGADDYVCKPFSIRELRARIEALLRRSRNTDAALEPQLRRGNLTLDRSARRVWLDGQDVLLSPTEFDLLEFLATHQERAFTREELMEQAWKSERHRLARTVDVHVLRLRKALSAAGGDALIQTVRGIGYRFSVAANESALGSASDDGTPAPDSRS